MGMRDHQILHWLCSWFLLLVTMPIQIQLEIYWSKWVKIHWAKKSNRVGKNSIWCGWLCIQLDVGVYQMLCCGAWSEHLFKTCLSRFVSKNMAQDNSKEVSKKNEQDRINFHLAWIAWKRNAWKKQLDALLSCLAPSGWQKMPNMFLYANHGPRWAKMGAQTKWNKMLHFFHLVPTFFKGCPSPLQWKFLCPEG